LDAAYRRWRRAHRERFTAGRSNPYLDPVVAGEFVEDVHRAAAAEWSYGGYLEDRRHLLAGSYLDATGSFVHLGVDIHVPAGTPVVAAVRAEVLRVDDDQDPDGGWGPRVFLRRASRPGDDMVGLFAHLQAPRCRAGDELGPGDVFAEVGGPPHNGNWHPHLHLQLLRLATFAALLAEELRGLDGYCRPAEKRETALLFPDPLRRW
jgi:murein DD-endopeptidase MepM/ murein hydrolase activator NlpD